MATTNLNMTLPTVGGSTNQWGNDLNADLTIIDGVFNTAGNGTSVGLNVGAGKVLTVAGALNVTGTVALPATANIANPTTYTITSVVGNSTSGFATATYSPADSIIPGTVITISGTTNYNGNHTVVSSSAGSATFASGSSATDTGGGSLYFPLTIITASSAQTMTNKTLQDPVLTGSITGTYSLAGTPSLSSTLTSSGNVTFQKADPILTFNNTSASFGYRLWANIDATDGGLLFQEFNAGWGTALTIASDRGLVVGGPTGGSQGVGTVNASSYYTNGDLLPLNKGYVYSGAAVTMAVNTTREFTHGLGSKPEIVILTLTATSNDAGYVIGDTIMIPLNNGQTYNNLSYGYTTEITSTLIRVAIVNGAGPLVIVNQDTRALAALNYTKWSMGVQAYV